MNQERHAALLHMALLVVGAAIASGVLMYTLKHATDFTEGPHFGVSVRTQMDCAQVAEDTRRSLTDSGASDRRAVEKSERAYQLCEQGRKYASSND